MALATPVQHPARPETELLSEGFVLDSGIIARLRSLGVRALWVRHDAMADLPFVIAQELTDKRQAVYEQLRKDFARMDARLISAGQLNLYRRVLMELVCELLSSRRFAGMTDYLFGQGSDLFQHGANVAYLSLLAGVSLENYIVRERPRLALEHSRDLTNLGLGGMLHDLGKVERTAGAAARRHEVDAADPAAGEGDGEAGQGDDGENLHAYRRHPLLGYQMLRQARGPASATVCVLTHHSRFDGTGWPDMTHLSQGRIEGPLKGRQIHVFARIVAAANVLDNLMREADGSRLPPIVALHRLRQRDFAGWFDPVVQDAIIRSLPPFPMGAHVRLSDGSDGAVVTPNLEQPCRPSVRLLSEQQRDSEGRYRTIQLEQHPELSIAECAGTDVQPWLFDMPPRKSVAPAA